MIKNQKGQVLSLAFLLSTETLVNYLHLLGLGKLFICSYMNITVCVCDRERERRGRECSRERGREDRVGNRPRDYYTPFNAWG